MPCSFLDLIPQKVTSFTRNKTRQISSFVQPAQAGPLTGGFCVTRAVTHYSGFNSSKTDHELEVRTGGFLGKNTKWFIITVLQITNLKHQRNGLFITHRAATW